MKRNQPSKSKSKSHFNTKPKSKPQRESRMKPRDENMLSKVYGVNAAKTFAKVRSDKIIRAFFSKDVAPQFSDLMKKMAANKKVYRIVTDEELERISQSQHHEGVCFNIELDLPLKIEDWLSQEKKKDISLLLALENVGNPHNLGAIMRLAAHFGVDGIAVTNAKTLRSGAAKRTAEGGAEYIQVVEANMKDVIEKCKKANYSILMTSSHKGVSLYETELPSKCVLFFGEEGPGLSDHVMNLGDIAVQIPGTNTVESLNVSSAIGIILGEFWKQNKTI